MSSTEKQERDAALRTISEKLERALKVEMLKRGINFIKLMPSIGMIEINRYDGATRRVFLELVKYKGVRVILASPGYTHCSEFIVIGANILAKIDREEAEEMELTSRKLGSSLPAEMHRLLARGLSNLLCEPTPESAYLL
jgi:hypothetical protein